MRVKRFVSKNIQEAMMQIKNEMGSDAVILHTRYFKEGGVLGLFKKDYVEITAAAENVQHNTKHRADNTKLSTTPKTSASPVTMEEPVHGRSPQVTTALDPGHLDDLKDMKTLMSEMSFMLENNTFLSRYPQIGKNLYARLRKQEIEEKIANKIVKSTLQQLSLQTNPSEQLNSVLYANMIKPLKKSSPIIYNHTRLKKPKIYALIGPTGVGKTTTIAKLAAMFSIVEQKKVSLVTIDTYRIAAVEQLKTIAEILNVPVHVVYSYNQMNDCLLELAASDIIFIDTAGRSHKNTQQLEELKNYLEIINPDETFLVLAATGKYQDMLEIIEVYSELNISRLIFTKLDETSYYGPLYNIACRSKYPLSYFTDGQNIPDDIEIADPVKLVQLLMKEQQKS